MADYSSANIPAPKDWQAFERKIRLLFEHSLGDPHAQNNGRIFQPQHGVDVYGKRGGSSGHYVGVQCKGKDANFGGAVTLTHAIERGEEHRPETGRRLRNLPA